MQAALGVAQLERIDQIVEKKRWIGSVYNELLQDADMINLPIKATNYCANIYWVYAITLRDDYPKTAKEVMQELGKCNIGTRPFFYPMHQQPVFNNMGLFLDDSLPTSERLYKKGFYIPSGVALTERQVHKVSKMLHMVLR